jgi:predicted RNA-binding Zn-ribbon protein involved in translation (DUF1610 family)
MERSGRVALCLALGAVTTVAVAWGLALRVVVPITGNAYLAARGTLPERADRSRWWCGVKSRPGLTAVVWELELSARQMVVVRSRSSGSLPEAPAPELPHWANGPDLDRREAAGTIRAESARGWPMRALWYEVTIAGNKRTDAGGFLLPMGLDWLGPGRVLPFRPIAPGLAVDTLFFAAIWYGALLVPGARRQASRWRSGRCTWCGYDLAHAAAVRCPECGRESQVPLFCRGWRRPFPSPWSAPGSWAGRTPTRG